MEETQILIQVWRGVSENTTEPGERGRSSGKIRYMNSAGLKRKFDMDKYVKAYRGTVIFLENLKYRGQIWKICILKK